MPYLEPRATAIDPTTSPASSRPRGRAHRRRGSPTRGSRHLPAGARASPGRAARCTSTWRARIWRSGTMRRHAREYAAARRSSTRGAQAARARILLGLVRTCARASGASILDGDMVALPARLRSRRRQLPERRHRPRPRGKERVGDHARRAPSAGRSSPGTTISPSSRSSCCGVVAAPAAWRFRGAIRSWKRRPGRAFALAYVLFGPTLDFVVAAVLLAALIAITAIDLRHQIIPDVITLPGHRGRRPREPAPPAASAGSIP